MSRKVENARTTLEKMLRYVLGIAPNEFGLVLKDGGFIEIKDLLNALRGEEGFHGISESRVMELVNIPGGKSSFEVNGNLIRIKPELASLPPPIPPDFKLPKELYIALKLSTWASVHKNGLIPKRPKENQVYLFTEKDLAIKVTKRFCQEPVLIRVMVQKAQEKRIIFSPYAHNIILCDFVPPEFLLGPTIKPIEEKQPKAPQKSGDLTLDSFPDFSLYVEPQIHKGKKKGKYSDEPDWKVRTRKDRRDKGDN